MSEALPPAAAYCSAVGTDRYSAGLAVSPMALSADWNVESSDSLLDGFFVWASASLPRAPRTWSPWARTAMSPWEVRTEKPLPFGVMGSPLRVFRVRPILATARLEAAGSLEPRSAPAANELGEPEMNPVASVSHPSRSLWRLSPVWLRIWSSISARAWPLPVALSCLSEVRRLSPRLPTDRAIHESAGRSATGCGVSSSFEAGASNAIESDVTVTAAAAGPSLATCGLAFSVWMSAAVCGSD